MTADASPSSAPDAVRPLLLYDADGPYEATRLVTLLAGRVNGASAFAFRRAGVAWAFRRLLDRGRDYDLLHAFGRTALGLTLLAGRGLPTLYTADRIPTTQDVAWVRAASRYRSITVVCDSDAERRRWVTGGIAQDRCVLVRPGVSLARASGERAAARAAFGFGDRDRVLFSPLPVWGSARSTALWTGSLLHVLDPATKLLVWNPPAGRSLTTLLPKLLNPPSVRVDGNAAPDAGFAAADLVLLPPLDAASPTLTAMSMASGLPIVASATPRYCELLEDRHNALLTAEQTPKGMAVRVNDAIADPALAAKVADRSRAEAYDLLLLSRLLRDFRNVYSATRRGVPSEPALLPEGVTP